MKTIIINNWDEIPENFTGIVEFPNGTKEWIKEGRIHREDGPAVVHPDGSKFWYKEGKYHREDGPAVEYPNGEKRWCKEGNYHREDGPAVEYPNGEKRWYINGLSHREDGPAMEWPDGYKNWYLEDQEYDQINLNNYIVLDYDKGEYGLMWYRLLDKDEIFEYPDIPGLIEK